MKIIWKNFIYEARDDYEINKVKRTSDRNYQYLQGVLYQLGHHGNDFVVGVNEVEATPENMFYADQIKRYEEYIENGGVIDSFPVQVSSLANTLEKMTEWIDEHKYDKEYERDIDYFRYPSGMASNDIVDLFIYNDEDEKFYKYHRLNRNARKLEESFPADITEEEKELLPLLEDIFDFFKEHQEYTLTDMNHRFQAVKNLGKTAVYVEPV